MVKYNLVSQTLYSSKYFGGIMSFINIIFTAFALSMDAMSVAIVHGVCSQNNKNNLLKIASTFGFFQFFMAFLGFVAGNLFIQKLSAYFKYISFGIFFFLGAMMIRESFKKEEDVLECSDKNLKFFPLILMGLATSIDSLLVGFTLSLLPKLTAFVSCLIIGIITFLLSGLAFVVGDKFGNVLGNHSNLIGGLLLIFISISILL